MTASSRHRHHSVGTLRRRQPAYNVQITADQSSARRQIGIDVLAFVGSGEDLRGVGVAEVLHERGLVGARVA